MVDQGQKIPQVSPGADSHPVQLEPFQFEQKKSNIELGISLLTGIAIFSLSFLTYISTTRFNETQVNLQQTEIIHSIIVDLEEGKIDPKPAFQVLVLTSDEGSTNAIISLMSSASESLQVLLGDEEKPIPAGGWPIPSHLFPNSRDETWFRELKNDSDDMRVLRNIEIWSAGQEAFLLLGEAAVPILEKELGRAGSLERVRAVLHSLTMIRPPVAGSKLQATLQDIVLNSSAIDGHRDAEFIRGLAFSILAFGGCSIIEIDPRKDYDLSHWDFSDLKFEVNGVTGAPLDSVHQKVQIGFLNFYRTYFGPGCTLRNLTGMKAQFGQTTLKRCKIINCNFMVPGANNVGPPTSSSLIVDSTIIVDTEFHGLDLIGSKFQKVHFDDVKFDNCILSEIGADGAIVEDLEIHKGTCQQALWTNLQIKNLSVIRTKKELWSGTIVGVSSSKSPNLKFSPLGLKGIKLFDSSKNPVELSDWGCEIRKLDAN